MEGEQKPFAERPLFRAEVLSARRDDGFGTALAIRPVSLTLLTLVAVLLASGVGALAFRGEYTRKARVTGLLVPTLGLLKVYSLETGTIVEKRVVEGSRVSKGDVLFVVSMERSNRETTDAKSAAINLLRARRVSLDEEIVQQKATAQVEARGLRKQVDAITAEIAQLGQEIKTDESRVASAQSVLTMYEQLFERQLVSREQKEGQRRDVLSEQGSLQAHQRELTRLTREREAMRAELSAAAARAVAARETTEREMSSLDQQLTEYESERTFVVTAPADGTATAVLADMGQTATPSQPLVSILPEGAGLQAQLFVPSSSIGFIVEGQTVAIRYQAFPYQRFGSHGGRVAEISRTLILPKETNLPVTLTEPAYRVIVTLDAQTVSAYGQQLALQAGMQLDANIWLDRRRLYQWLLDPLYSVRGGV